MDPITLRFFERLLAVAIGGLAIYLGYRLFLKIPEQRDSDGQITLPWNTTVILSRVGPGVFFALFGTAVVSLSLYRGLDMVEPGRTVYMGQSATEGEPAGRADARPVLLRDIAILNTIPQLLRADLPGHDRIPVEQAIPRIKFALMKSVWSEEEEGWSTPAEFENWRRDGEPDPPPSSLARAVEYYRYGERPAP